MNPPATILIIEVSGTHLAVDAEHVRTIRGVPQTTPLPSSPPQLLGVFHHEGRVIPLFDLIAYAGGAPGSSRPKVVIIQHEEHELGIVVEDVLDVLPLPHSTLEPAQKDLTRALSRWVEGRIVPGQETPEPKDDMGRSDGPTGDPEPAFSPLHQELQSILQDAPDWLKRIHLQDGEERQQDLLRRARKALTGDHSVHFVKTENLWAAAGEKPLDPLEATRA